MCRDVALQQLERAGEITSLTLLLKNVLFIYIFPPRCATGEFNDKQNQKEVLSNIENITNVIYEVSHLDMWG